MLKTFLRAGAAMALVLAPAAGQAQVETQAHSQAAPVQDADPALWVVKDEDTTIYLFGTVHVLKPGLSWFDEAVKNAFDASDEIVLEMVEPDEAEMQALVMRTGMNMSGPTLTQQLPEDKRAALSAAAAETGLPVAALDRFDPWLAGLTITAVKLQKLGFDPNTGAERMISAAAEEAGKPVSGLETAEEQLMIFDNMPADLQTRYFVSVLDQVDEMGPMLDNMVVLWANGDPDALGALLNEELRDEPELARRLLADRNARWAEWIDARLDQPGTAFVAVGAGHLAGEDSLQHFLAQRALNAERIAY